MKLQTRFPSRAVMEINGASRSFKEAPLSLEPPASQELEYALESKAQHLCSAHIPAACLPRPPTAQLLNMCPDTEGITLIRQYTHTHTLIIKIVKTVRPPDWNAVTLCCEMAEGVSVGRSQSLLCSGKWLDHECLINLFCKFRIS